MSNSIVTVVMAVYNAERFLERTIETVRKQSYTNWKLICVDDGSQDNSSSILRKYANLDSRISFYIKDNGGPASARALAYEKVTTPYAIILDSDDLYSEDLLEECVKTALETNADCIAPNMLIEQSDGSYMDWNKSYKWKPGMLISGEEAFNKCFVGASLHGVNMWKTELLRRYGVGENASYNHFNEDEYIQRLLFINSNKVVFSKGCYIYRRNSLSITKGLPLRHLGYLSTCRRYIDLISYYNITGPVSSNIKEYYLRHLIALQLRYYKSKKNIPKEDRVKFREAFHFAYEDAMQYRECYTFADKKLSWLYKFTSTNGYGLFCLSLWLFSFFK